MPGALWSAFVDALPFVPAADRAADAERRRVLVKLVERGVQAWPDLALPPSVFAVAIARAIADRASLDEVLTQVHAEDLYLTCGCAAGDERAIAAFQRSCGPVIERALVPTPIDLGAEVVQIAPSSTTTCAVYDDFAVRCWGWNFHGQLGQGHTTDLGIDEAPTDLPEVSIW